MDKLEQNPVTMDHFQNSKLCNLKTMESKWKQLMCNKNNHLIWMSTRILNNRFLKIKCQHARQEIKQKEIGKF